MTFRERQLRMLIAALAAAGITLGLFLLMYELILSGGNRRTGLDSFSQIRFGKVEIPEEIRSRSHRRPPPPQPPKAPPARLKMPSTHVERPLARLPHIDLPELNLPLLAGGGMFIGNFRQYDQQPEGEVIPVVVIRPMYPRDAAIAGTEGWVKVEFTITESGSVRDARVIDAEPPRVFNREAIRAILKWKFKPRVVDGVAVERRASQIIDFSLDNPEE